MKTDLSQSCGQCWAFHIWHVECSTSAAPLFRIWNNSAVIPSPQLAFFIVMLSKAHLTSHFRLSGTRRVTTPLWLRSFLYSSVLSCHILISYASLISLPFLSFIMPILAWNVPLVSDLDEIAKLSHSIVFFYFLALFTYIHTYEFSVCVYVCVPYICVCIRIYIHRKWNQYLKQYLPSYVHCNIVCNRQVMEMT